MISANAVPIVAVAVPRITVFLSASEAAEHLKQKLGIGFGETTPDRMFTLKQGECFGACGDAPVVLVNNKRMCSWMRPAELDRLLAELAAEGAR